MLLSSEILLLYFQVSFLPLEIKVFGLSFYTVISLPLSPFPLPSPLPTTKSYSVVLQPCLFGVAAVAAAAATANKQPLL